MRAEEGVGMALRVFETFELRACVDNEVGVGMQGAVCGGGGVQVCMRCGAVGS